MHTRVVQDKEGVITAFNTDDRIFLGEGLFETLRVENAQPCFSQLHWGRLSRSAEELGIAFELSYEDWLDHLIQKIRNDNLYNGGIKVILTGGSAPRGLTQRGKVSQLILQTFNYTLQTHPLKLITAKWLRDSSNPVYKIKSINYLEAIIARSQATNADAEDVLFFNTQNCATETTCANVFIVKEGTVFTSQIEDGVLAGITRSRVLHACKVHKIPHYEHSLDKQMLEQADAMFITNSLQGIRVVRSLDQIVYQLKHPLVERLISALSV
ncbi:aminotransferase class IV [Legionella waltersii]|uniref:Aminodeoxychorismate lyase n=1 Tax=Legionella waltersii TaxID=66969 RepID=A0A0W1ADH0_9GAMM|nr:aminotransferase class IV [Legionella waltersii]KTD79368.1 4-amino-4-deoxychorismate lyase [Legionella waltersii]SNU99806.1 4-amino-4-deoxychorismate lyase [Legionella waltersii]